MVETESQTAAALKAIPLLDLATFLVTCPPNCREDIAGLGDKQLVTETHKIDWPVIQLPCDKEDCGGQTMFFDSPKDAIYVVRGEWEYVFVTYFCRHCHRSFKQFALGLRVVDSSGLGEAHKYGEVPAFGERIPPGVLRLVQPDFAVFRQGLRSENHGLGIGAFGYYRRVVERQKDRLFDKIISVARSVDFPADKIEDLEKAKASFQFESAVEDFKDLIPQSLLIKGHNPLTLLHRALSRGLHNDSDEECLELARDIRAILTELALRATEALRSDAELGKAISHLTGQGGRKETK